MHSSFNKVILEFYKKQSLKKYLVVHWLPALPLLHFLRRESKPFEDVICESPIDITNWKWWGLGEFSYRDIRRNITARLVLLFLSHLRLLYINFFLDSFDIRYA